MIIKKYNRSALFGIMVGGNIKPRFILLVSIMVLSLDKVLSNDLESLREKLQICEVRNVENAVEIQNLIVST